MPKSSLDSAVQFVGMEWDFGASIDTASYKFGFDEEYTEEQFGDQELAIEDSRGFDILAHYLYTKLEPSSVKTNCIVTKIETSDNQVKVSTANGLTFSSKDILITTSIGVL